MAQFLIGKMTLKTFMESPFVLPYLKPSRWESISPTSSLLNISNGYCLFNQRNGIHTLANSFHVCRCQSEGVEVFWFSYLSFTDDKEGLFNQP